MFSPWRYWIGSHLCFLLFPPISPHSPHLFDSSLITRTHKRS